MNIRMTGLLVLVCLGMLLMLESPCAVAQANEPVKGPLLRWGGPGDDSARSKGSTRFAARVGSMDDDVSGKPTLEMVIDTEQTYKDLAKLILVSADRSESAASMRRWKSQRHRTASWTCVFLVEDINRLPDEGLVVAKDSYGKTVLTEKVNICQLKTLIADVNTDETRTAPNKNDAGAVQ